jgi:hypothetical protein
MERERERQWLDMERERGGLGDGNRGERQRGEEAAWWIYVRQRDRWRRRKIMDRKKWVQRSGEIE